MTPPPVAPEDVATALGWPVIVESRPSRARRRLTLVKKAQDLGVALKLASRYDDEVMTEQFIPGIELTVGVLATCPCRWGQIESKHELFDCETSNAWHVGGNVSGQDRHGCSPGSCRSTRDGASRLKLRATRVSTSG